MKGVCWKQAAIITSIRRIRQIGDIHKGNDGGGGDTWWSRDIVAGDPENDVDGAAGTIQQRRKIHLSVYCYLYLGVPASLHRRPLEWCPLTGGHNSSLLHVLVASDPWN